MKTIKCPSCAREREVEDDAVGTVCLCGEYLKFSKLGVLTNDLTKDEQLLLKQSFNRGREKGKEETIQKILDSFEDNKIKVNLK